MAFIVMYERTDGSVAAESCEDLDAAIGTAERLRNVDAVNTPRIYETTEVRYDFRPYYHVHVVGDGEAVEGGAVAGLTAGGDGVDWSTTDETSGSDSDSSASYDSAGYPTDADAVTEVDEHSFVDTDNDAEIEAETDLGTDTDIDADTGTNSEIDTSYDSDFDADAVAGSVEGEEVASESKPGLFDKFVKTLEGDSSNAGSSADDVVDDLSDTDTSRRGLFGR